MTESRMESLEEIWGDLGDRFNDLLNKIPIFSSRLISEDRVDIGWLEGVVRLWLDVLDNLPDDEYPKQNFVALPYTSAESVRERIERISYRLESSEELSDVNLETDWLYRELESTIRRAESSGVSMEWAKDRVNSIKRERDVHEQLARAAKAAETAEESASRASQAAGNALQAAGDVGEGTMSSHFDSLANTEARTADWFRWSTIAAMIAGGGLAVWLVLGPEISATASVVESGDYVHLIQRLIATGAIFALAGYLARQAHQHRTTANWARALAVQLQTFDAFMGPVQSDDVKDQLRTAFAAHVFAAPPRAKGEPAPSGSLSLFDKALDLARNGAKS